MTVPTRLLAGAIDVRSTRDVARLSGRLALLCAAIIAVTGWFTDGRGGAAVLTWIAPACGAYLLLALAAAALPWERLAAPAALVFPVAGFAVQAFVGWRSPAAGPAYVGLFYLWFVVIGLSQRPATGWAMAPLAALAWWTALGAPDAEHVVRLAIAVLVWGTVSSALSLLAGARARRETDLVHQAETDALTGLPNRRALEEALLMMVPGDVVVVLDIDHFKTVNDTHGHGYGDQVLRQFAATLESVVRGRDVVARYGGEEFVVLLGSGDVTGAARVLARLRTAWGRHHPQITWSAGAAIQEHGASPTATLRDADRALYEAKRAGRDRVVVSRDVPGLQELVAP